MPRRKNKVVKRPVKADPKFNSVTVARLINCVMIDGKKSTAERIVYGALGIMTKANKDALATAKQAIENVKPLLELKSRRIGGANYQIPVEVNADRRTSLAVRWLINAARERKEKLMQEKLANELMAAASNQGGAIKKKEDTHRAADANKAFAHYRW